MESFVSRIGDVEEPDQLERLVAYTVDDAVLIAFGEGDNNSVSAEVLERLRPFRLDRRRRQLELWISNIDELEADGRLDATAATFRREARDTLALLAAGIEPDDDLKRHLIPPAGPDGDLILRYAEHQAVRGFTAKTIDRRTWTLCRWLHHLASGRVVTPGLLNDSTGP